MGGPRGFDGSVPVGSLALAGADGASATGSSVFNGSRSIEGTDQIRAEIHCKGVRRGGSSSSTANSRPDRPRRPPEGPWSPAPREPSESPTSSSSTTRALPGAPRALQLRSTGAPRARAPRECARRSRSRCARPVARSSGLSMECGFVVFPEQIRTTEPVMFRWCQTVQPERAFLPEPRRFPAAAGLPRPEAGSGAPGGLR